MNPNLPELPDGIEEADELTFVWIRNARSTRTPEGSRMVHEPSRVCCLPGGTTPEELEALAAWVRAKQSNGPAAKDRSAGVTPGGPPPAKKPRKAQTKPTA